MAERRMFAKTIIDSDAFLDMPLSTQALYFHLSMRADDDGFINNPKKIQRMIGASDDDLKVLVVKRFIIPFESGIVVIKHWKLHNYIRNDRYKETVYQEEKALLVEKENKAYTIALPIETIPSDGMALGIPNVNQTSYQMDTQVRLGKVSIEKNNNLGQLEAITPSEHAKIHRFKPPSVEEVQAYCKERKNTVNPETFVDFYSSKGWMVGKNKMKDWKAAVRTWEQSKKQEQRSKSPSSQIRREDYDSGDQVPW